MTQTEKAIREFCGHHADWWPSTTQVREMLALAQPCPTCEALARTVMLDQTSHDQFNPDWDAMAVMVEEQQRMAKRIAELEAQPVQQEPVAFASHGVVNWIADKQFQHEALLYSAPQRTWVGLTDEEKVALCKKFPDHLTFNAIEAIEAKLKEKNT